MKDLLRILIAPLVWLAAFSAVYALQGLGCAIGLDQAILAGVPLLRAGLIFTWLLVITVQVGIFLWLERTTPVLDWSFKISRATAGVALVAAIWALFPVTVISVCR